MKTKILLCVSFALFLIAIGIVAGQTTVTVEQQNLSFEVKLNKERFNLGEPIQVEFVLTNQGSVPIKVPNEGVESGSLKLYVAGEDMEYKEYFGSGWGRKRGTAIVLEPGRSKTYGATLLWNGKPRVAHLNEEAAKRVLAGKITTEYALPTPGVYFIKGVSSISAEGNGNGFKPVRVVVEEPKDEDLEVWNQIKGNREIALLMQKGAFDTDVEANKQEIISKIEQILIEYPDSVYSSYLRPNLEKFKADEIRRKEVFQKSMKPNNQE